MELTPIDIMPGVKNMNNKLEHLKLIQNIITRMTGNSFYLKGWTITLVSCLIALTVNSKNFSYLIVSFIPLLLFWVLDSFYLRQERLYRKLYDATRLKQEKDIDFSMDIKPFINKVDNWILTCFSKTLLPFYGSILAIVISILLITL